MRKISARSLLDYSAIDTLQLLTGEFILVFDDGKELATNARETQYSRLAWDLIVEYPNTQLLEKHHVRNIIGGSGSYPCGFHGNRREAQGILESRENIGEMRNE